MAKSIRSKVKRRFRTAKRGVVKRTVSAARETKVNATLEKASMGIIEHKVTPPNAFRSDDPDAVIPQHTFTPCTDFRSEKVEEAGFAITGNRRVTHPLHLLQGDGEEGGVMVFGPGDEARGDAAMEADAPEKERAVPFEDEHMNYDGTPKVSGRSRRRGRGKKGGADDKDGFAFWGRKAGKR